MPQASIESICNPIRKDLEKVEQTLHSLVYSPVEMVTQVASHIIHSGGKRLRPILCILAARLFGYQGDRAVKLACAFEFIHTATLLHDDVIDNAELRRGRPSSNYLWGNKASVLVGDYLYCKATSIISEDGDFKVLEIIARCTAETTEGEVLEIIKSNDPALTEETYLEIIQYKTARLISATTHVGALLGRASEADQERLKNYGIHIGMAFQLADDALDYLSSDQEIGKLVGIDLKEGKLTLPLIHTMRSCTPQESERIQKALQNPSAHEEDLKEILALIDKYQGMHFTLNKAKEYIQKAKGDLASYPDGPAKRSLLELADYVIERKK
ncbi:MAG: polyprenyl synthetase family protein [Deltaproteobacteria bacterium]|nr:polyprenyl synthetase family protein [Deltaproteobacteria bacterium]